MLVLSRKTGERTIIAGNVRVVVLSVQGDRVKLGFDGPPEVPIHREEVLERMAREEAASGSAGQAEKTMAPAPQPAERRFESQGSGPFPLNVAIYP